MRPMLVALLLLAGCDDDGPKIAATASDVATLRAEVDALKMQIGAIPPTPDVRPLADRLAAVEAAVAKVQPVKLHRIAPDGTDYGIGSPGSPWVYNEKAGGEFDSTARTYFVFESNDCTGTRFYASGSLPGAGRLFIAADAHVVAPILDSWAILKCASMISADQPCEPCKFGGGYASVRDTGVMLPSTPLENTHLELR